MYDNELMHYGVKGQKWGVRRYQNANGTLTAAGRKRIAAKAGWYMNPSRRDKHSTNRRAISEEYTRTYSKLMRKHGINTDNMDAWEADRELAKKTGKNNMGDKLWNSFLDKYADATLKDIGYADVAGAKEYVKELFRGDLVDLDE